MKLTDHIDNAIKLSERINKIERKLEIIKNDPHLDIIFKAIIKVGEKDTELDRIKLIKRYLKRYYKIDMDSRAIKTRLETLKNQLS